MHNWKPRDPDDMAIEIEAREEMLLTLLADNAPPYLIEAQGEAIVELKNQFHGEFHYSYDVHQILRSLAYRH